MTRNRTQNLRSSVALQRPAPATREPGELFMNFKDRQFGYIDPAQTPVDLLSTRYFSTTTSYLAGEYVHYQGRLYRSAVPITAGPFDQTKWYFVVDQNSAGLLTTGVFISDIPPSNPFHGQLWWESDTGNTFVWVDDLSSKQWVQVNILPANAPYIFFSRADLVAKATAGFSFKPGSIYVAPPLSYIAVPGATAIRDLPGLLPFGEVHVGHFGAKGDMTWEYKTFPTTNTGSTTGPYRLTGTNDLQAFIDADSYTTPYNATTNPNPDSIGSGYFYAEDDGYYLGGMFILQGKVVSRRQYRNFLWVHAKNTMHSCIWINSNAGGVVGFSIIDQYENGTGPAKPFGHGHMGCGITICPGVNSAGGPGLYTTTPQPIIQDIEIDCQFCRAGNGTPAGLPSQYTNGAYHIVAAAGLEYCHFKVGMFGRTNRNSNGLMLCHWGMQYQNGDPNDPVNWYNMELIESYHCCDCTFEFISYFDQTANPHGLVCYFELASGGSARIGDIAVKGVMPLVISPGDCINYKANPRQKEKVMKGIRIGYVSAVDVPLVAGDQYRYENSAGANFYIRGFGTSKFNNDFFPGTTDRNVCRQITVDVQCKGFELRREGKPPAWNGRAIYLQGCFGKIDLGAVETYGIGRGFEIEYCDGDQTVNYVQGDGCLLYEFSRGGRILQTDTDRNRPGYIENPDDGGFRPGNAPGTKAVSVGGGSYSTLVSNQGDVSRVNTTTRTWIVPFAGPDDDVYKGTPIKIGTQWVTATEFIQGRSNGQIVVASIQGITNSNPAIVTSEGVGSLTSQVRTGMLVGITGVNGMLVAGGPSSINGRSGKVTIIDDDHFSININTAAMTPYISGGNIVPQLSGVPYLDHTPLTAPAAEGTTVFVEEFCRVKQLSLTSAGGESGLRILHASVDNLDMHGLRSAHKFGVNMTDGRATLRGPLPPTVGVSTSPQVKNITGITKANPAMFTVPAHGLSQGVNTTIAGVVGMTEMNGKVAKITVYDADHFTMPINSTAFTTYVSGGTATQAIDNYTFKGDAKSLASMTDGTITANERVAFHFFMGKDDVSGAMGHVDLRNCRIEDITSLMVGSKATLRYGLTMHGCTDTQKNQNLSHPAKQGQDFDEGFTDAGVPVGKGLYNFGDDGILRCWARGIITLPAVSEVTTPDWANSTAYAINDAVKDPVDNSSWKALVAHTSPASGTFAAARAANPTFWGAGPALTTRIVSKYRWWFPARFNAGGDTVVVNGNITTNYDPTVFRNLRLLTGSSVYCDIEVVGGAVGTTYSIQAEAVGRYFDE
jgi:hypothetical protein